MKILIAEDDLIPRRLLESILRKWDYEVVLAADGEEAWRILQEPDAPRLAILDWLMPGLDGLEVCRRVRARADAPYVYVILLTAKDQKEDVIAGMGAGADDYLIKPVDFYKLEVRLRAGRRILDLQSQLLQSADELARVRRSEVELGAHIQQTLLLGKPPTDMPGLQIAALTVPSQQVDGDFYDFFPHGDQCLDVVVGDVMGKGVAAALLAAATKSQFLRALSDLTASLDKGNAPQPQEIVAAVHAQVTEQFINLNSFETLCYARFDLAQRRVDFVDAGHTATIQYQRSRDNCLMLQGKNMPLGFDKAEKYEQLSRSFEPGDLFVFYSDGITEAMNAEGEQFGVERILGFLRTHNDLPPGEFIPQLRAEIARFTGTDILADDMTCVVVKMERVDDDYLLAHSFPLAQSSLEVKADLSELTTIWTFVREFCANSVHPVLDEDLIYQLELAVVEAASNIIKHAYHGIPPGSVLIEAQALSDGVSIEMYDWGVPFDADAPRPPSFDGSAESGFGLYIIAQSVNEVQYWREEAGRNGTRLVQRRRDFFVHERIDLDQES